MVTISPRLLTSFTADEIRTLFSRATTVIKTPAFEIRRAPTSHVFGRVLIMVYKKAGNAPQRNTLKRRIKALFYEQQWYTHKYDIMVIVRQNAEDLTFDRLKELLAKAVNV